MVDKNLIYLIAAATGVAVIKSKMSKPKTVTYTRPPRRPYRPHKEITAWANSNQEYMKYDNEEGAYLGIPKQRWYLPNGTRIIQYGQQERRYLRPNVTVTPVLTKRET